MALFEFQYRWADIASRGMENVIDELEARDVALEQFIRDFECGSSEFPLFIQITGGPIATTASVTYVFQVDCTLLSFNSTSFSGMGPFTATHTLSKNGVSFFTVGPAGTGPSAVVESFIAGDILTVDVTINSGTVDTHSVDLEFDGTDDVFEVWTAA